MELSQRYQIVLMEPGAEGLSAILRQTISGLVTDLQLDPDEDLEFLTSAQAAIVNPRSPKVGVYFGSCSPASPADLHAIQRLISLGSVIIPVVSDKAQNAVLVPEQLHPINSLDLKPNDPSLSEIANSVLESIYMLRDRRRVFISYKRTESEVAALQLYQALDARGYDVFLDTYSVRPGDPFQDVLWHRMLDSDIVVLLHTPGIRASKWVAEEITRANAMGMTILELVWPTVKRDDRDSEELYLFQPKYLEPTDFRKAREGKKGGSPLKQARVKEIVIEVERLRARALASRETRLVKTLCDSAHSANLKTAVQRTRCVDIETRKNGKYRVFMRVGVPDSHSYETAWLQRDECPPDQTMLLYDPNWILPKWQTHLDWLGDNLPIKRVLLTEVNTWLAKL